MYDLNKLVPLAQKRFQEAKYFNRLASFLPSSVDIDDCTYVGLTVLEDELTVQLFWCDESFYPDVNYQILSIGIKPEVLTQEDDDVNLGIDVTMHHSELGIITLHNITEIHYYDYWIGCISFESTVRATTSVYASSGIIEFKTKPSIRKEG